MEEQVYLDARRHGIVLARPLAGAVALAALGGVLLTSVWPIAVVGAAAVAAGALVALRAVWRWERTRFVVTIERVYELEGTLRCRAKAIRLRRIDGVEVEQTIAGRLLGYGTLVIGPLELDHVSDPRDVTDLVERLAS